MTVTEFTPLASALGGALIGIAAVMLIALNGRIAGISGIVGRLLPPYASTDPMGAACFVRPRRFTLSLSGRDGGPVRADGLRQAGPDGDCGTAGRLRRGLWRRLHQRTWGVRDRAIVAALDRGNGDLHGDGLRHGLRHASRGRRLSHAPSGQPPRRRDLRARAADLGMADPAKVQNFLDLAGAFDPSLIFVRARSRLPSSATGWCCGGRSPFSPSGFIFRHRTSSTDG